MSIISSFQRSLDGIQFFAESLENSISFKSNLQDNTGEIYVIESRKSFMYSLEYNESACFIESIYFNGRYVFSIRPVGFSLYTVHDRLNYLNFINVFWIDNQEIINDILGYLVKKGEDGRLYGPDALVQVVNPRFSPEKVLSERIETIERIMDMLANDGAVGRGELLGEFRISFIPETKNRLESNRYTWA